MADLDLQPIVGTANGDGDGDAANGLAVAPDFFRYSNKFLQIWKSCPFFCYL